MNWLSNSIIITSNMCRLLMVQLNAYSHSQDRVTLSKCSSLNVHGHLIFELCPSISLIADVTSVAVIEFHLQNEFWSLEASRSVWEDVECKLRSIDGRRLSYPRRAFRPAFGVTGISDDWSKSTMCVNVTSLGTSRSTGENYRWTWERRWQAKERWPQAWERWRQVWKHLASQLSSLGQTTASLGTLLVRLEIIATAFRSTIFKTPVFTSMCRSI